MIHKFHNKINSKNRKMNNKIRIFFVYTSFLLGIILLSTFSGSKTPEIDDYRNVIPNESQVPSIKYNVYMVDFTKNPVFKGETTTVRGYVLEFDEDLIKFVASSGMEVQLFIDGILNPSYSGITDTNGNFTIDIDVEYTYDIYSDVQVNATVIDPNFKTSCKNYIYLDVRANVQFVMDRQQEKYLLQHESDPGVYNYFIEGHIEYGDGSQAFDLDLPIDIGFGPSRLNNISFIAYGGYFSFYSWIPILAENNRFVEVYYDGSNPQISASPKRFDINVVESIIIQFDDDIDTEIFDNTELIISGRVYISNNESYDIPNSDISMSLNFMGDFYFVTLDNNGRFSERFFVPENRTGIYSANLRINRYMGNDLVPISNSISITVQEQDIFNPSSPNYIPFDLIIIGIVVVVAFIGLFIFMRWRLRKVESEWKEANYKELNGRLRNVNMLISTGRFKEAIAYLYKIYAQMSANKFNIEKATSQTTRDYAIQMVREYGANPAHIYPFIQNIESVLYGGETPTNKYSDIKQGFINLYNDLLGSSPPEF